MKAEGCVAVEGEFTVRRGTLRVKVLAAVSISWQRRWRSRVRARPRHARRLPLKATERLLRLLVELSFSVAGMHVEQQVLRCITLEVIHGPYV